MVMREACQLPADKLKLALEGRRIKDFSQPLSNRGIEKTPVDSLLAVNPESRASGLVDVSMVSLNAPKRTAALPGVCLHLADDVVVEGVLSGIAVCWRVDDYRLRLRERLHVVELPDVLQLLIDGRVLLGLAEGWGYVF